MIRVLAQTSTVFEWENDPGTEAVTTDHRVLLEAQKQVIIDGPYIDPSPAACISKGTA